MKATARLGALDPRRRKAVLVTGIILLLSVLAVPFGLNAVQFGPGPASESSGSVGLGAPGLVPGADPPAGVVAPSAPSAGGAADGRDKQDADASGVQSNGTTSGPGMAGAVGAAKLARTAWLGVEVNEIAAASRRVRAIALAAGGQVLSENIVTAPDPTGGAKGFAEDVRIPPVDVNEGRLTLSVPADKLDSVLEDLTSPNLGRLSYWSSQSEDVTEAYVDTSSRIQPAKDSIARIRSLMVKATALDQIVMLESELSRRQADLDSLQQRLGELERRTTTSEVSVTLWTDAKTEPDPDGDGIAQSLTEAWNALVGSVMIVLTGLAVLLPWLLVGLVIAWFVRRWMRRRSATKGTPAPATD